MVARAAQANISTKREGSARVSGTQTGRFGADGSQNGMQRRHHLRAFTHRRSNPFDRA
jgi:hypothetical protein